MGLLSLGILIALFGVITTIAGGVTLFIGAVQENKKRRKTGARILLAGAISLLVSFTLCTNFGAALR
jgi:uncharacterized membrane protein YidH (DUF202 family)